MFVAVDLPGPVLRGLAAWAQAEVGGRDELRVLGADTLHLTLAFLGERPLARVDDIADIIRICAREAVPLGIGAPLWLAPRRPHVLTVAIDDPAGALASVHRLLEEGLVAVGVHEPDRRAFRPHVTVARVRRGAKVAPKGLTPPEPARFSAKAVTLYRSRVGRTGAQYEALATEALPRAG